MSFLPNFSLSAVEMAVAVLPVMTTLATMMPSERKRMKKNQSTTSIRTSTNVSTSKPWLEQHFLQLRARARPAVVRACGHRHRSRSHLGSPRSPALPDEAAAAAAALALLGHAVVAGGARDLRL